MSFVKRILQDMIARPSLYLFVVLIVFTFDRHHRLEDNSGPHAPFEWDVREYYRYLPDIFIDGVDLNSKAITNNKRTIGMAIMYSPGFMIGHAMSTPQDQQGGYGPPYAWAVRWCSIIYVLLALWFCRKALLYFFKEWFVMFGMVIIFFGTNLFYYTYGHGEMPHAYLFFLYSAFILSCLKYLVDKRKKYLPVLSFLLGFITLVRPTGILVILFPVLFGVNSLADVKERMQYLLGDFKLLLLSFVLFISPLVCQMVFWKCSIGQFLYYSYGRERFFFNDPQIINFLFSYRKGWFVYTPLMLLSVLGIVTLHRYVKAYRNFIIGYLIIVIYLLSSWWDWSYGGSFGCRVMVESYAFLAFPLVSFLQFCWETPKRPLIKYSIALILVTVSLFGLYLNKVQTWQFRHYIIHWGGMNKETYWYVFLNDRVSMDEIRALEPKYTLVDPEKMLQGDRDK